MMILRNLTTLMTLTAFFNENGIGDGGVGVGVGDGLKVAFATPLQKQKFVRALPTLDNGNAVPCLN